MAFKKSVTTVYGVSVSDAYHRVEHVEIIQKDKIKFRLRSYATTDFPHFSDAEYEAAYDISGENPIFQAYTYLKTQPQFAGAVDC